LVITCSTDQTINMWRLYNGAFLTSLPVGMNLIEANMAKHDKTIVAIGEMDNGKQLLMFRVSKIDR
jgi:hypothetical protein